VPKPGVTSPFRTHITMPREWVGVIDEAARLSNLSRSQYVCALAYREATVLLQGIGDD
jgi:uncharacterized protein (DUF1778 family)